ncbi:HEAT repeat domain-containing protein [Sphingobacterium sp. 1.A.4]|uniref:HEAT repeat domain-containing protein n=1 Tax=Sphingobacterium sp. 1.A.4 TaxID=2044603 RepID=UPI000C0BF2EA|nr:HEAT repeat domain-containing protein [Sphingobacterium sp. 1.A.4]
MELSFYLQYYLFYLQNKFMGYPFVIRLTVLIVMGLIFIYILSLIRFVWINLNLRKKERDFAKLSRQVKDRFVAMLGSDEKYGEDRVFQEFEDVILRMNNKTKIQITDLILNTANELKEAGKIVNEDNYRSIIHVLDIPSFWETELMSNNSKRRHIALRKLDNLGNGLTTSVLMRSTNHKNKGLRKQARAAVMKYDNIDPFKFLEESFDTDFNALDEIMIHHFLVGRQSEGPLPLLSRWVQHAKNHAFKAFMIKEIGFFNQMECAEFLKGLLKNEESKLVRAAIIESLGNLGRQEVEHEIFDMYSISPVEIQTAIINAVAKFKTKIGLDFLTNQFFRTTDNEQKVHLAYAIKQFGEEGKLRLTNLSTNSNEFERKIFDQVNYQLG